MISAELTFEKYLIIVGTQLRNYTYDSLEILNNIEYFKECFINGISASKALDKFIEIL